MTTYGPQGYHVILTDRHVSDERVLQALLERKLDNRYIGMIGSRSKTLEVFRRLMAAGVGREDLARVYAPVGIDHGGQTAEEIALAICAELVAVRHDHTLADSMKNRANIIGPVSYTHLRAHETRHDLVCRLLLEKKNKKLNKQTT